MPQHAPPPTIDRIVLGTVQLGLWYGRRSGAEAMPEADAFRILDRAWDVGIRRFDTAEAYGCAAERLASWLAASGRAGEAEIITKVPVPSAGDRDAVHRACRRFPGAVRLAVLTHGAPSRPTFDRFALLALECDAVPGVSAYSAAEIVELGGSAARRVQAPMNVIDGRQLLAARAAGIPFDGRSVYLQGVLLDPHDVAEGRVPGAGRLAEAVAACARDAGLEPAVALLAGALASLGPDDRVVVGVDSPEEVDAIVEAAAAPAVRVEAFRSAIADAVSVTDAITRMLDPRTWKR
jgi:aryl-alcohol dehydrogenase-like predicted oxidoreductase